MNPFLPGLLWVVVFMTATEKQARPGGMEMLHGDRKVWIICKMEWYFWTQHTGISRRVQKRAGLRNLASCVMLLHCFASLKGMVDYLGVSMCDNMALCLS